MADAPVPDLSLLFELAKQIQADQREMRADMREIMQRLTSLDLGQAGIRRDLAALAETDARIQVQLDRMTGRLDRIERRLDLTEA
jgi:hypothetical protein